jgi:hypothetical protein
MERPYLTFEPSAEQLGVLAVPEFSFEGKVESHDQNIQVRADTIFTEGWKQHRLSPDVVQNILPGEPWDLQIAITQGPKQDDALIRHGVFWLTSNPLLSPALIINRSHTGEVKIEKVRELSFQLAVTEVRFCRQFRYEQLEDGTLSSSELVAEFDELEPKLLQSAVEQLDDFLLVTSLATRHPCVCRGWRVQTDNADRRTYRSRVAAPRPKKIGQQEILIDPSDFKEFISHAYATFRQHPAHDPMSQAINHLVRADEGILEPRFFSLFSALETLITNHRSSSGLNRILDEPSWNIFESDLRNFIKTHSLLKHGPDLRKLIYEKVPELNRIAFGTAFRKCVDSLQAHGLNLDDLWPVTGSAEGQSLTDVRNKLIHGDVLTPPQEEALIVAKTHLVWCIERMLLALLDWPVERSLVDKFLRHTTAYNGWQKARDAISKLSP